MTQEQQIRLVNGRTFFGTADVHEAGVPRMQFLDGGTGMNFEQLFGDMLDVGGRTADGAVRREVYDHFYEPEKLASEKARELHAWICDRIRERLPELTPPGCYPPGMLLGATWDPETVGAVGHALGHEARAYGVHVLLGTPNVNLHRDPRAGRCFEGYSEDPCLIAELAPALVRGVQAEGVAANVKHFAANNQETNRRNIDEHISERALHEIYYPGFKACIQAGCATLMAAYNRINGVPCTENTAMLTDLLRGEWGFNGLVMSDWGAVYHPAAAVNAGTDVNMPGPVAPDALRAALADGSLNPMKLAESAERVKALAMQYAKPATGHIDLAATDKAAYDAAAEGIVMLKNAGGCCPLPASASIALCGAHSERLLTCGEGSARVNTTRNVAFSDALSERFSSVALGFSANADTLIYVLSTRGREGNDLQTMHVSDETAAEIRALCRDADAHKLRKILVLNVSAPVGLCGLEECFDAVFCCFLPGMQGAPALADILAGKVNPSGHLPLTFPRDEKHMPTTLHFPGDGMQVEYGEGIFAGYRWYLTTDTPCLYPFGYGLSYTSFAIGDLRTDRADFTDAVQITLRVHNTGKTAGKTVVQLYVSDPVSRLTKPLRELKAFRKVALAAGESKEITFALDRHAFESYDPNLHMWTLEEGVYRIEAGFSAEEIACTAAVYADVESPYTVSGDTAIRFIYEDAVLCAILRDFMDQNDLAWDAVLVSYEYSSQDTLDAVLGFSGITPAVDRQPLYDALRAVRRA